MRNDVLEVGDRVKVCVRDREIDKEMFKIIAIRVTLRTTYIAVRNKTHTIILEGVGNLIKVEG